MGDADLVVARRLPALRARARAPARVDERARRARKLGVRRGLAAQQPRARDRDVHHASAGDRARAPAGDAERARRQPARPRLSLHDHAGGAGRMANAMIVAPQALAAEAGRDVLKRGGNAVDAAVTTAFVQGVVDPMMCGIGGSGVAAVYEARTGEVTVVDFYARAGSA